MKPEDARIHIHQGNIGAKDLVDVYIHAYAVAFHAKHAETREWTATTFQIIGKYAHEIARHAMQAFVDTAPKLEGTRK